MNSASAELVSAAMKEVGESSQTLSKHLLYARRRTQPRGHTVAGETEDEAQSSLGAQEANAFALPWSVGKPRGVRTKLSLK